MTAPDHRAAAAWIAANATALPVAATDISATDAPYSPVSIYVEAHWLLHRVRLDGGYGWRINAGCVHFEAATVEEVCDMVRANVAVGPAEWADASDDDRLRWAAQVDAALTYLTAMVEP